MIDGVIYGVQINKSSAVGSVIIYAIIWWRWNIVLCVYGFVYAHSVSLCVAIVATSVGLANFCVSIALTISSPPSVRRLSENVRRLEKFVLWFDRPMINNWRLPVCEVLRSEFPDDDSFGLSNFTLQWPKAAVDKKSCAVSQLIASSNFERFHVGAIVLSLFGGWCGFVIDGVNNGCCCCCCCCCFCWCCC